MPALLQRRLLSIAEELIADSSRIIFIDEPLTDLDEKDAGTVVRVMQILVKMRYTVVATFHELSNDVLKVFGSVHLLCKGRIAFSGSVDQVSQFFTGSQYKVSSTIIRL